MLFQIFDCTSHFKRDYRFFDTKISNHMRRLSPNSQIVHGTL